MSVESGAAVKSGPRIGLPRALWYYTFYPFWRAFFNGLGASLIPSSPTTKAILDAGILETVSEACVPIKVFLGHVQDLRERWQRGEIDMLFLPRYVSWQGGLIFCPKFLGLPDMVRYAFESLPPLLTVRIDRRAFMGMWRACDEIRIQLGAKKSALLSAYRSAWRAQAEHESRLRDNWRPTESIVGLRRHRRIPTDNARRPLRLAVLGYPYLVYDDYVGLGVLDKLDAMGVEAVTAETLQAQEKQLRHPGQKDLFWHYSEMVKTVGFYALSPTCQEIDGVIHVTAFACGPDAMVNKLLELEARKEGAKPFLSLGIDEETGEAGCLTRLEAFVDMLRRDPHRAVR
ncbi:MAG: acyl-CoA dehydratase activase-related protein [Limnochordia bacterium]|jgi:predicted nucleotide-binding protein (sugar kinase/HSP70/actin superfamily)